MKGERMIQLTNEQEMALQLIMTGQNVFLTGKAGTGKSAVLHCLKESCGGSVAFVAPTGLAAMNIGGSTIHGLFRLPPVSHPMDAIPPLDPAQYELLSGLQPIVIDEVSMLRSDMLVAVDTRLKQVAPAHLKGYPFGGKQVVVVGDFAQLSPVIRSRTNDAQYLHAICPPFSALHEPGFLQSTEYDPGFMCFAGPWAGMTHRVCLLLFESVQVSP